MHPYGISGKLYEGELHANELTVLLPNAGKPVPTLALRAFRAKTCARC